MQSSRVFRLSLVASVVTAVLIAGCGGGAPATPARTAAGATQPPAGGGATPAATAGTPASPAATVASLPSPAAGATQGQGGGQGIANFCLNTNEEVSSALGESVVRSEGTENPGFGGGCIYYGANDALIYSIGFVPVVPGMDLIETGLQTQGAVEVTGIGERAVLMSAAGPLVYRKGSWTVTTGGAPTLAIASDAAAYRIALEELARAGSTRF